MAFRAGINLNVSKEIGFNIHYITIMGLSTPLLFILIYYSTSSDLTSTIYFIYV